MYDYQQPYASQQFGPQQFAPQGLGSMFGGTLGAAAGRGLGGLLGNANLGGRLGQMAGDFLGNLSPFSVNPYQQQIDPQQLAQQQYVQQQLAQQQLAQQQQQLAPQGLGSMFGGALGAAAGRGLGGLFGNANLGRRIGQTAGDILGGLSPFAAGPQGDSQQQAPLAQLQQLQSVRQQLEQALQQIQQQQAVLQQQVAAQQGGQIAPQSWISDALTQYALPVGSFIGTQFGNQPLGSAIGTVASQIGRLLPQQADPYGGYPQQAQYGGQQTLH